MRVAVLVIGLLLAVFCGGAHGRTWLVAEDGSGDFVKISEACRAVASGDSVLIAPGRYTEEEYDDPHDPVVLMDSVSLVILGLGASPRDVSITLRIGYWMCPEVEIRNLWFHDGSNQVSIGDCGPSIITDCIFEDNTAVDGWNSGGGLYFDGVHGGLTVEDCSFIRNRAFGPYSRGGGLFYSSAGDLIVRRCLFQENQAEESGGAIDGQSGGIIEDCVFDRNSSGLGAAISVVADCRIRNCTFWGNTGFGAIYAFYHGGVIDQCILSHTIDGPAIYCNDFTDVECCAFWDNPAGNLFTCPGTWSHRNFEADPLFCGAETGDFTLNAASPCLPENQEDPACGLIGRYEMGCGAVYTRQMSWGKLKTLYR